MFLETIWLVNKTTHAALYLVILWAAARLPLFVNMGILSVVLYNYVSVSPVKPIANECELMSTESACTVTGACYAARQVFNSDFEWARYRRNLCKGVSTNKNRLTFTYSGKNCDMWGGCDDNDCMTELESIRNEIETFECPFDESDKEMSDIYYPYTDEVEASLYPGGELLSDAMGISVLFFVVFVLLVKFFL